MVAGPLVRRSVVRRLVRCAIITAAILLAGCAALPRNPVPLDAIYAATIPGMPGIRAWGGKLSADFQADAMESMRQEQQADGHGDDEGKRYASLALSGGGSNGAFGAGYLQGWTAAGTLSTPRSIACRHPAIVFSGASPAAPLCPYTCMILVLLFLFMIVA